jgi:O-antigen ligase
VVIKSLNEGASVATRSRTPKILIVALVWVFVVDIPTNISLGPLSLSGAATLCVAAALIVSALGIFVDRRSISAVVGLSNKYEPYLPGRLDASALPFPMVLFLLASAMLLAVKPTPEGLQNTAVYAMFALAIPVVAAGCSAGTSEWALGWFRRISIVLGILVAAQSLLGVEIYGPRSAALVLVVLIGITLALPKRTWLDWALPFFLFAACALTLSRTALFVSAILLPLSLVFTARRNGLFKVVFAAIPIYYIMYVLVTSWAPLRDRFMKGDAAYSVGGFNLNTSGRTVLWEMTVDSWQEAPLTGKGPGSASALISAKFDNISHPHNDYLRILHDFGLIGFLPFVAGLLMLLWMVGRRARTLQGPVHKAAALALLGVIGVATTDNVFVYPFVMLPVGVLIGLSLAQPNVAVAFEQVKDRAVRRYVR